MRILSVTAAALTVASCGTEAPTNQANTAAVAATPTAGEYEVTTTVTAFRSTDNQTPVVSAKQGDTGTSRACVGADGTLAPELFAASGDQCTAQNAYVRSGRINLALDCTRKGTPGKIMSEVNGSFTAEELKGSMTTTSFIQGPGDYELRQDFTARRVGECKAAPAKG